MDSAGALQRIAFRAMGTKCEIQYACDDPKRAVAFERTAVGWVQAFEAKYSRFRDDSLIGGLPGEPQSEIHHRRSRINGR